MLCVVVSLYYLRSERCDRTLFTIVLTVQTSLDTTSAGTNSTSPAGMALQLMARLPATYLIFMYGLGLLYPKNGEIPPIN